MKLSKLLTIFLTIILLFSLAVPVVQVSAKTSEELAKEIIEKQKELDKLEDNLKQAETNLEKSKGVKASSLSEIEQIQKELNEVQTQLQINELKQQKLQQQINLKELEKEGKQSEQDQQIQQAYIYWKTDDVSTHIFGSNDLVKNAVYQEFLSEQSREHILGISSELKDLNETNNNYRADIELLQKDKVHLDEQKLALEKKINDLESSINASNNNALTIRSQIGTVQQQIDQLTAQQKAIEAEDDNITKGDTHGGTKQIISGEIYFSGTGRDLYQGHGVGMSQFGVYGGGQKGMTAEAMLKVYYANTKIVKRTGTIHVVGNTALEGYVDKSIDFNTYAAGLGEVPDKACGTAEQAVANPAKYIKDNTSTVWDCWPEESIKAQVIAARSYAASYGGAICTTAACQVFKDGKGKQWAADETKDLVIISTGSTHNGQIIRALYSSDNSQGYGTADNDTIWSNFSGVGTVYSYLRHADDSSFAKPFTYTNWSWRTNSYTVQELDSMLTYAAQNYNTGGSGSFLKSTKSSIGKLVNLSYVRDGSNRIKKVNLIGDKGTKPIAGWLFKAIWNSWVSNTKPSGETDYLYSITWFTKTG